jgi:hypothetical protein
MDEVMISVDQQLKMILVMSAVISTFVIAPVAYMAADYQPPYEYDASRSYIIPDPAMPGNQLLVHWELKKVNRICTGSITRFVVDALTKERIAYDPTTAAQNVELDDTYLNRTLLLPSGISPGDKEYYADGEFHCNLLQRFFPLRVRSPRLYFSVSPPAR